MVYAVRQIPRWTIDGKRVLAFAGVLLLHLMVLGMVLLPREPMPLSVAKPDDVFVPMEVVRLPEPPPLPPPPITVPPPPVNLQVVAPPPTVVPQARSTPVTTTTEIVLDTSTETPVLPQGEFDSGSTSDPGLGQGVLLTLTVKSGPPPAYPRRELAKGIEGDVLLRVLVDPSGMPQTIEVIGGSRNRNFERAAINALKRWRFQPHTVDGAPRSAWASVPVTFRIQN